jgi:flagellar hook-basal body complex protein FliE
MDEIRQIGGIVNNIPDPSKPAQKSGASFDDAIKEALKQVSDVRDQAEQAIEGFSKGEVKDIHTVVIAMEKADVTMQTLMAVRTKLLNAYEEVMRMQV